MFQQSRALFIYCVTPVHMGAGTALGLIDNPIQREVHTKHPTIAGSGIKGALRHWLTAQDPELTLRLFGPDSNNASDNAGAVSFGDAQLVAFPIRNPKHGYIYATSPLALARARRLLQQVGLCVEPAIPTIAADSSCLVADESALTEGQLDLELFRYEGEVDETLSEIAALLAEHALPADAGYDFFRTKLKTHLVLLSDESFNYFVQNATVVEPHVRIDDKTGTADDGGLFYTENLPPESLLLAPVMASVERIAKRSQQAPLNAEAVITTLLSGNGSTFSGIDEQLVQIGGDATTGRGQVVLRAAKGE